MKIFAVILILLTFRESFLLGVALLSLVLWEYRDKKHLEMGAKEALKRLQTEWEEKYKLKEDKLKSVMDAVEEEELTIDKDFEEPKEMAQRFVNYNRFIIEDYGGWYIVKYPDMRSYPKMFMNIVEAQKTIDMLAQEYKFEEPKRSKIQNIRFVR